MFNAIDSLYHNFVGEIHFACVARLLGYQGIAVIIEELLKVIKSVVGGSSFITAAQKLKFSKSAKLIIVLRFAGFI